MFLLAPLARFSAFLLIISNATAAPSVALATNPTTTRDQKCAVDARVAFQVDTSKSLKPFAAQAKEFSGTLLDRIASRNKTAVQNGGRIDLAVVSFGPIETLRHFGSSASVNSTKTRINDSYDRKLGCAPMENGIRRVMAEFESAEKKGGEAGGKTLVLFTDGQPTHSVDCRIPPSARIGTLRAAQEAKRQNITIYTVFVGAGTGKNFLKNLASSTNRSFDISDIRDANAYKKVFQRIVDGICQDASASHFAPHTLTAVATTEQPKPKIKDAAIEVPVELQLDIAGTYEIDAEGRLHIAFPNGCPFANCGN